MAPKTTAKLNGIHPRMLRVSSEGDPQQMGKELIGRAIDRALTRAGLTQKEAAFTMGYSDSGVIGRWITGTENPQVAKLWLLGDRFRRQFVIALAEAAQGVKVVTQISLEESA